MNSQLVTCNLKLILILILISGLLTIDCGLIYSQDDYLRVKGNTKTDTLTFSGNLTAHPVTPLEGELFYNSQEKSVKYFDGTTWQGFGATARPKTVATKIVAASNTAGRGSRADYICDGTDDQLTIQEAIDALGTTGGAVYLLEGTYNISGSINLNNTAPDDSKKAIIGTGRGTVLKITTSANNVKVINASNVSGILISQLMIEGNAKTGNNNKGIDFNTVTASKIDKVWVENVKTAAIYLNSSSNNTITNNRVQNNGQEGVYLNQSSNNSIANNNVQSNAQQGIYLNNSSNNILSGNNVKGNQQDGVYLAGSGNVFSGNTVQSNGNRGIYLNGSNNHTITGNKVQSNAQQGIYLNNSSSGSIAKNYVWYNSADGIRIDGSAYNTVGNNIIAYSGGDGVKLDSNSDTNIISSNRISNPTGSGYGINLAANTCGNNYIIGNLIEGYISGLLPPYTDNRINDNGTNTKYTDRMRITWEPGSYTGLSAGGTLTPVGASSYLRLAPTAAVTLSTTTPIEAGKSAGDILILEGTDDTKSVSICDSGNVKLCPTCPLGFDPFECWSECPAISGHKLKKNDVLILVWDGSAWVETGYSNKP